MKNVFLLLLCSVILLANEKGYEEYCRTSDDYKKYLFYFERYNSALLEYKNIKNKSVEEKSDELKLTIASNYYGLLYSSCFSHIQKEKTDELLSKKF